MAAQGSHADSPARTKKDPVYTIVEIRGDGTLLVIDPGIEAKTQEAAMDTVWDKRPDNEKKVHLGAFLAGSFRDIEYDATTVVKATKKKNEGTMKLFGGSPTPAPE